MTTHRERLLGQARADLTALPELCDQLDTQLTERPPADGYHHKIVGSPALIRLDVFHLTDPRRKDGWELEDPRHTKLTSWLGVAPLLESWVRVLWEEIPELLDLTEVATVRSETSVLLEHWAWVEGQQWGEELAKDVIAVTKAVRASLGIKPERRYKCPTCSNPADLIAGGILLCEEGHDRVVRDLERQQRRRPPMTTAEITAEYGVNAGLLRQWKLRRKITPVREENGKNWWLPWDVFCLLNPDIAEAINLRDEVDAASAEPA